MERLPDPLRIAHELQAVGDIDGAVHIYEEILKQTPDHPGVLHLLGMLMNRREDYRRGVDLLERAVLLRPGDPVRHADLGECYRSLGDYRCAIGCCLTALRLRPDYAEALNTLGLALLGAGDCLKALENFRRAISVRPDFSPAYTNAGRTLQDFGALEEAIFYFRNAADLEPDSALTNTNLGLVLLAGGQATAEALTYFKVAVHLRPDLAITHHNLGNALRILGHPAEARASYLEAIRLDPHLTLSYIHIGLTFRLEGLPEEAAKWYEMAVENEPNNPYLREVQADLPYRSNEEDVIVENRRTSGMPPPDCWADDIMGSRIEVRQDHLLDGDWQLPLAPHGMEVGSEQAQVSTATSFIGADFVSLGRGRWEAAFRDPGRVDVVEFESVQAITIRGIALVESGQADEALAHFQEAARLRPDLAAAHHNLGEVLRVLNKPSEARASYLMAIRLDPHFAPSYLHVGTTLLLENSADGALAWHMFAVEMEPDNPNFWEALADLQLERDESSEAVECQRRVVELLPDDRADARISLGWALQEDERPDEAMEQYEIAFRMQPFSPQVHIALGGLYEELGEMHEAERSLREALRLQPKLLAGYARLAVLLKGRLPDDDLRTIESFLGDANLPRQPRARLLFGIAHVLDARGQYASAAASLREANALSLEMKRAEGVINNPDAHERFVSRVIQSFDEGFFRRTAGLGLAIRRPVFVVGLPRSGTTLVEQILASHPGVYGAGEQTFAAKSFDRLPAILGLNLPPLECISSLDEYDLKRLAGEHLGRLNALDQGRFDRIVDKLPDNYIYVGLLVAMFPSAVIIHCRRDIRDVALSCWMTDFRSIRWANDTGDIASRLQQYLRLAEHWERVIPDRIFEVRYEDTVSNLEGAARRLLDVCGLDWDPTCLDFHRTKRPVRTASYTQVRQPIYATSVSRWMHYRHELADLFAAIMHESAHVG